MIKVGDKFIVTTHNFKPPFHYGSIHTASKVKTWFAGNGFSIGMDGEEFVFHSTEVDKAP